MQFSIVYLKDISSESNIFRLDAEFFHPQILNAKKTIRQKNGTTLREMEANIIHPTEIKREYAEQGIQILLAQNIRNNYLDFSTKVFMPEETEQYLEKNKLKIGDIALTRSGANYGQCAAYSGSPSKIFACADDLIIRANGIATLPKYLATFLNTSFGKILIESCKYGAAQPHIAPQALYDIPIHIPSNTFIELIDSLITESENQIEQSKLTYQLAQDFLLVELGMNDWKPTHQLWGEKSYLETVVAGRIDAEYYQPKYDEIIKIITSYSGGSDTLENLCELVGHPSNPTYADSEEEDKTFVVTQKHLGDFSLNDNFWKDENALYTTEEFIKKNSQYLLKDNDVLLYSVGAYIGKANIYNEDIKATIGSFLTLIRAKKEKLNPYYLMVFLNTDIGIAISKQHQRGMAQQYLYPYDIRTFPIPLLPEHKQLEIQEKVMESFELRVRSKTLLENAKRAVEIAIEQDETTAIQFLNSET